MNAKQFERILQKHPRYFLMDQEIKFYLPGTSASRHSLIKRLKAEGRIVQVKRGLYYLPDKMHSGDGASLFELAPVIYSPSYISFESALSFHQLIPEAVYTITSATTKRSKEFSTPLGVFSFTKLPLINFFTEVQEVAKGVLMAKPWKAICDYVYCYKKNWEDLNPLEKNLRIDLDALPQLGQEKELLDEYYQSRLVSRFLKGVSENEHQRYTRKITEL